MTDGKDHLRTVVNPDGAAILDAKRGTISTLNPTGAFIWCALQRGEVVEDIVAALVRQTLERPEIIRLDVINFISALRQQELVPEREERRRA